MSEFSAKDALEKAKAELRKEKTEKAVKDFKVKLRQIEDTKVILANLERELQALEKEIELL